ncbi:MAG: DUF721 domain-containing protein [Geobacteraceae bacterium]|nr:DUF721 domain-containing protein [Geobacteraceae bacterium]
MADKKPGYRFPTPLAALLTNTFRGKPLEKRFGEVEIWRIWDQVVGKQIATKAQPSRFQDGVLSVVVVSAPWMHQLNFMKRDITERLNEKLGANLVREIFLKAGRPLAPVRAETRVKPKQRELTAEEKARVAATVEALGNPEVRRLFAELLERDIARTPRKE